MLLWCNMAQKGLKKEAILLNEVSYILGYLYEFV